MAGLARLSAVLALAALAPSCASLAPVADPAPVVRGPLRTRIAQPPALIFPGPRPRRVATAPEGAWRADAVASYASVFEFARVSGEEVLLDGELLHVGLLARRGLGPATDVEVELPLLLGTSGFLDAFVDEFHAALGFPDGARPSRDRGLYSMEVRNDGTTLWALDEDRLLVGDVPVTLTHRVRDAAAGRTGVALRAGLELPTGDEGAGAGSGGVDGFLGVLLERDAGRWTFTGGADLVLVDTPDRYTAGDVEPRDALLGTVGVEYRWDDSTSLLAGVRYRSPFTTDIEIKEIDRPVIDLALGLARDVSFGRVFAAFHEDVVAESGPDLVLTIGASFGR